MLRVTRPMARGRGFRNKTKGRISADAGADREDERLASGAAEGCFAGRGARRSPGSVQVAEGLPDLAEVGGELTAGQGGALRLRAAGQALGRPGAAVVQV